MKMEQSLTDIQISSFREVRADRCVSCGNSRFNVERNGMEIWTTCDKCGLIKSWEHLGNGED